MRAALLLLLCSSVADGLALAGPAAQLQARTRHAASPRAAAPVMGGKKKPTLEELGYWAGEWVCADCGFIYEPGTDPPFEELRPRWKCPQCAGPRRRFVKKAGSVVGRVDDSPLIIGTAVFALLTAGLVYLGLTQ